MDPFVHILFGNEYMNMKWIAIILFGQVFFTACRVPFQALLQCSKNVSVVLYYQMARYS
jgi:O-antigen/teichoic acid export membrane protein